MSDVHEKRRLKRSPDEVDEAADEAGVGSPLDLEKKSWWFVLRKTVREFLDDQCTDLAAALTYYGVLALFPAAIALTSVLGLLGQDTSTSAVDALLQVVRDLGGGSMVSTVEPTLTELASNQAAGLAFVLGLAGALWSASGYVGAFGRAMNTIYEIPEGRPVWKLRPAMLLLTLVLVLLAAAVLLALVLTGPVAESVGNAIGIGSTAVTVWQFAKWPVLFGVVVLIVALLFWGTPNIKQPKFRWVSLGALTAIIAWVVLSAAFGWYVANLGNYDATYGALGGVIAFLLWLWLTNLALLFGAELDAELERGRELQAGLPAEETIQLPPRDARGIKKAEDREKAEARRGREIRKGAGKRRRGVRRRDDDQE
ncbi:YihY/virulence factor BrkB family protein [Nocardioides taihuensis]|uniref:YihY/virulence factor BrkB family protein n=1 Tax=Nocardioides taihuensis TaxID=1835606 RepID=A0ABW0BK50_9ACTN